MRETTGRRTSPSSDAANPTGGVGGSSLFPHAANSIRDDDTTADDLTESPVPARFASAAVAKTVVDHINRQKAAASLQSDGGSVSATTGDNRRVEGSGMTAEAGQSTQRTKSLKKRRTDGRHGDSGKERSEAPKPVGWGSRMARAQWVVLMWAPLILLFLHRESDMNHASGGQISTNRILIGTLSVGLLAVCNELADGINWPYYIVSLCMGMFFGGTLLSTKDLTAARLLAVAVLGIGAGQLRHHWTLSIAYQTYKQKLARRLEKKRLRAQRGARSGVSATEEEQSTPHVATPPNRFVGASDSEGGSRAAKLGSVAPTLLTTFLRFLAIRLGILLWFGIGEIFGCAFFVREGFTEMVLPSWGGYLLVVIFPLAVYKVSSWLAHLVTLVFGSKQTIADASKMLVVYWVGTAVLSLTFLVTVVFFFMYSWIPYIWSLQLLVAPYGIVVEFISCESRKITRENPYKEVVEAYKEHIDSTIADKDKYIHHHR